MSIDISIGNKKISIYDDTKDLSKIDYLESYVYIGCDLIILLVESSVFPILYVDIKITIEYNDKPHTTIIQLINNPFPALLFENSTNIQNIPTAIIPIAINSKFDVFLSL